MPDGTLNRTRSGWPYLDANNFIHLIDEYSHELATKLEALIGSGVSVDLSDYATKQYVDDAVAAGAGGAGTIELVSGTVSLGPTGSPVREFYCTAGATIGGVTFPAGTTVVWRRTPTGSWGYIVVDGWTATEGTPDPDPELITVTATAPNWADDTVNGGGTWTTPTITGVAYSPASGSATPGQSVTVTATAQSGYTLTGTTSWTHAFPSAPSAGAVFFTDFSEYATGTTSLPGWTTRWNPPSVGGATGVFEDSGATGGKVFTIGSPSARVGLSLDQFDGSSGAVEAVTRWRAPSSFIAHPIRIFGSGDSSTAGGYYANSSPTTSKAAKYVAGSASDVGTPVSRALAADTWSWTRMRVEDGMVYLRWWADGETEPETWNVSAADTSHTTGWVGIGAYKDVTFDVVGIATDGSTAPKEAP